jgi:hypothetical protein
LKTFIFFYNYLPEVFAVPEDLVVFFATGLVTLVVFAVVLVVFADLVLVVFDVAIIYLFLILYDSN